MDLHVYLHNCKINISVAYVNCIVFSLLLKIEILVWWFHIELYYRNEHNSFNDHIQKCGKLDLMDHVGWGSVWLIVS